MSSFPLVRIIGFGPRQHGGTFSSKLHPCAQTHLKGRNQLVNFKFTNATVTIQKSGYNYLYVYDIFCMEFSFGSLKFDQR